MDARVAGAATRPGQRSLADESEAYNVVDTTLIPAVVRVRACRKGLFAGQAAFGTCVAKTEWIYGFKVALSVTPRGRCHHLRSGTGQLRRAANRAVPSVL